MASYKVKQYINSAELKKDLTYSPNDLSDAMMQQAGLFAHYAEIHANAERQVDDLKLLLEAAESRVYRELRDIYTVTKEKVTEAFLEKEVAAHKNIRTIKLALNEAKQIAAIAKGGVEAFRHRKDMLVQNGATERQEREGEMRMHISRDLGNRADSAGKRAQSALARLREETA